MIGYVNEVSFTCKNVQKDHGKNDEKCTLKPVHFSLKKPTYYTFKNTLKRAHFPSLPGIKKPPENPEVSIILSVNFSS